MSHRHATGERDKGAGLPWCPGACSAVGEAEKARDGIDNTRLVRGLDAKEGFE